MTSTLAARFISALTILGTVVLLVIASTTVTPTIVPTSNMNFTITFPLILPLILVALLVALLYFILTWALPFFATPPTLKLHIASTIFRPILRYCAYNNLSFAPLLPTTEKQYLKLASRQSFAPLYARSGSTTHGFWIGNPTTASKILVWYHGGAYINHADAGHMTLLWDFWTRVTTTTQPNFAIFIQKYDLTSSGARYPTQLRQAVEALRNLLAEEGFKPSQIMLGGDSAGGHLVLSVLGHVLHPHAEIERLDVQGKLAGALCVSPWTSFDTERKSMRENKRRDFLPAVALRQWSDEFLKGRAVDGWSEPDSADSNWWKGLDGVVERVGVTGGGGEVLIDGIRSTVEKIKHSWKGKEGTFEYVEADEECHDMLLTGTFLGDWDLDNSPSVTFARKWVVTDHQTQ